MKNTITSALLFLCFASFAMAGTTDTARQIKHCNFITKEHNTCKGVAMKGKDKCGLHNTQGKTQCEGITAKGKRCKRIVSGKRCFQHPE